MIRMGKRHTIAAGTRALAVALLVLWGALVALHSSTPSALAHHWAPSWNRGGTHNLYLAFNDNNTQYSAAVRDGVGRYTQNPNMPIIFNLQSNYSMSNFDFSDNPGLPSNTLGRTHNSTTAGSDNVCAQGTITYVWIELNPNGLGSDWSKQLWTVMHEAGHGIALGHSEANDCGINGGYPSVGYGGSIMYSGYPALYRSRCCACTMSRMLTTSTPS